MDLPDKPTSTNRLSVSVDLRLVCLALIIVIGVMLVLWKPWDSSNSTERKITISGESTIKAEPDEYQFSPYYEKDSIAEVTTLNEQIVKKLKELGVKDSDIKNNASSYGSPEIYYLAPDQTGKDKTALNLTIIVDNKALAQKVQDYLITTNPKGSITPYPSFSTAKKKQLTDQARDEAIADAKKRAEKTASGLDAKIGKVIEVSEGQSGGGAYPLMEGARDTSVSSSENYKASLSLQPGQDEFNYSVQVTYELK